MEFAGLALAIYPATVLAFEQYKKGAKYISDWARYRRKYEAFIRDMEGQQLFFEGILQDLLCGGPDPFLTGSSSQSKDSFLRIATDASFTGWKSPVLKQRLKARLDSRYEWCMYTIKRIYDIMIELGELLDIQALESSSKTPDWWRFQWKRIIQTLFAEGGYEEHKTAKRLIEELKQMIELSDKQRTQGVFRLSTFAPFFQARQENARNLHEVLRSSWQCCCNASHKVMLQLERKVDRGEDEFNMLCVVPPNDPQDQPQKFGDFLKRGVHVKASRKETKVSEPVAAPAPSPTPSQQHTQSSPIRALPSPPTPEQLSYPIITKVITPTDNSKSGSFRLQVSEISSSLRHKLRRKKSVKEKEVRRFDVVASMQTERIDEEQSLKAAILFEDSVSGVEDGSKTEAPPPPSESNPITDLCEALQKESVDASLGYLEYRDYTYDLLTHPVSHPEGSTMTTLNDLLEANARQLYEFPAEKRAIVATVIASSLLQLQRTHWISETWSKNDIFFTTHDRKVDFSQPYLSHDFVSTKAPTPPSNTLQADTNMPPSTTAAPKAPPASSPKSFHTKRSLECLGILLIELCFGVPIERWQDKVRLRPMSPGSYNHEFNLAIANAWTWEEIRAHDPLFSDPINSCLHFPHRRGTDEMVDDMYELIAKPLYEETWRKWPPLNGVETY